jgi:hypothetical protein
MNDSLVATTNKKLNLMQADFVEHLCTDALNNASLAYRLSYPKCKSGVRQSARNLLTKTYIRRAIAVKKAELAKKTGFKVEDAHALYQYAYEKGDLRDHTGAMVGAATGIARLYGMDKDSGGGREQTVIIIGPKAPVKAIESQPVASKELPCP